MFMFKISTEKFDSIKDELEESFDYFTKMVEKNWGDLKINPTFDSILKARKGSDKDMLMVIPDVQVSNIFSFDYKGILFDCDDKLNISWRLDLPTSITDEEQIDEIHGILGKIDNLISLYYGLVEDIAELVK